MDLALSNNIKSHKVLSNFLYLVRLKKLDDNICSLRGKWGYFYEYDINNLDQISKFIKKIVKHYLILDYLKITCLNL